MKNRNSFIALLTLGLVIAVTFGLVAQEKPKNSRPQRTPEEEAARAAKQAADDARRKQIPIGGNFNPNPKVPVMVAVAAGMRIALSRDDGRNWKQVFYGATSGDHGYWATFDMAYSDGVFVGFAGWGSAGHGSWIASDDGTHWRHLAGANRKGRYDPQSMGDTFSGAGGNGAIVGVGGSNMESTPDFGKTWYTFNVRKLNPRPKTHHMRVTFADYKGGRLIILGDGPHIFYSDDLGKSWKQSSMKGLGDYEQGLGRCLAYHGGVFLLLGGKGAFAWRSTDGGETWQKHTVDAEQVATHGTSVSIVNGEFWVTGKKSRASKDGIHWRDLPATMPIGRIIQSNKGTLINVNRRRHTILRSTDGKQWREVYRFEPDEKARGGQQGFNEAMFGYVRPVE